MSEQKMSRVAPERSKSSKGLSKGQSSKGLSKGQSMSSLPVKKDFAATAKLIGDVKKIKKAQSERHRDFAAGKAMKKGHSDFATLAKVAVDAKGMRKTNSSRRFQYEKEEFTEQVSARARLDTRADASGSQRRWEVPRRGNILRKFVRKIVRNVYTAFGSDNPLYIVTLKTDEAKMMARALGLRKSDLRLLKNRFEDCDTDEDGTINLGEFAAAVGEESLTSALFHSIDKDGNKELTFDEFILSATVYCAYAKEEILRFWFDYYDDDKNGFLDEREFFQLCNTVNENGGDPFFKGNFCKRTEDDPNPYLKNSKKGHSAKRMISDDVTKIDFDFQDFIDFDRRNPLIFHPAFRMQERLQNRTLGTARWHAIVENLAYHMRKRTDTSFLDDLKERLFHYVGFHDFLAHPPVDLDHLAVNTKIRVDVFADWR